MRAVSTETLQRPATSCFPTTTAGIPESYSTQTFKIPSHCLSTTLILQNPGQRRLDFIITFRTDLFIKVYQRILSADYTVLSILPSANPLNEWDGFSVIGGNVEYKNSSRLRGTFLSSYKKVEEGYNPWIYYCIGYFVYTLLN